ncbi:MAG TPA: hypothetical protein DCZ94_10505 [Lentisphaeria bacterium]|nr:MAG: hypothetical protein A2X48_06380 [Lentisphaerae bacterium GWF2_49_21]HBC87375.1 hypothetical protein [Lentisphaeria bacterium]
MNDNFDVSRLKEYLDFDYDHISMSRKRQCQAWRREKLDVPLLFIGDKLTKKQEEIPAYDLQQVFTDKVKMLCREARGACGAGNGRSDSVPSIRANLGTGIMLACLGLEQESFPDKMPWLHERLTKEQIIKLKPDDIKSQGSFARGLEMMHYFKDTMGDSLPIYVMDTQGPFDLAHLMMGDDIFLELYDDPKFVHHLMGICLELGIKAHRWMKEAIGEPMTSLHHSNAIYSDSFGIRICEDTTALLGDEQIREFAIPYTKKLAREFGGAWVHYCGYNEALTDAILEQPELKALNFGHIPGHEQEIDFYANMEKFAKAGKVNFNGWPRFPDESAEAFIGRIHKYASQGVLAANMGVNEALIKAGFKTAADVLAYWKELSAKSQAA